MISYCVTCLTLEAFSNLFTHLSSSLCYNRINSKCDLPLHQMQGIEDLDFHTQRVTINSHSQFKKNVIFSYLLLIESPSSNSPPVSL